MLTTSKKYKHAQTKGKATVLVKYKNFSRLVQLEELLQDLLILPNLCVVSADGQTIEVFSPDFNRIYTLSITELPEVLCH